MASEKLPKHPQTTVFVWLVSRDITGAAMARTIVGGPHETLAAAYEAAGRYRLTHPDAEVQVMSVREKEQMEERERRLKQRSFETFYGGRV